MSFKSFWNTYIIPQRTKENPAPGAFTIVPGEKIDKLWDEFTGKAAIEQQNQWQMELAKYQAQVNEDFYNKYSSPAAMMRQYQEAGLNPNLIYGSAASGQGNVPSFQAPNIQRNLSGSDKVNKALSMLGTVFGLQQMIYQADAAREAAEQSSIKTLSDLVNYRRNARDYNFENLVSGYEENTLWRRLFRNPRSQTKISIPDLVQGDLVPTLYDKYIGASRENYFSRMAAPSYSNEYTYQNTIGRRIENKYLEDYLLTRNMHANLLYDIDYSLKKATTISGAAAPWLNSLTNIVRGFLFNRK